MNILGSYDLDLDTIGGYFVMCAPHGNCTNPMTTLSGNLYGTQIEPIDDGEQGDHRRVDRNHYGEELRAIQLDGQPVRIPPIISGDPFSWSAYSCQSTPPRT